MVRRGKDESAGSSPLVEGKKRVEKREAEKQREREKVLGWPSSPSAPWLV